MGGRVGKRARRWVTLAGLQPVVLGVVLCAVSRVAGVAGVSAAQAGKPQGTAQTQGVQAPKAAPTQDTPPESPQVRALITAAEQSYASGVTNYQAGHLDAARHDFDAAVDGLLMGGIDIHADPALSDEMDRLLNSVNSLEMSALKTGNGFTPNAEDAPLAAADTVTFTPNASLTAKVQTELQTTQSDLPLVVNDYVTGFINYYSNNPTGHAHLLRSLERAGKYRQMISKDLADAGVPQDLIYLAVAESGFQPQVVNARSGAAGMWQFMPFLGAYGLARNGYVDERFDPEKSSKAYAHYMKSLYDQFGDWYLAMAAYDWGPGYVQRAVMKTGYADYWELYRRGVLPGETKNYVPGILAAAIMAKNPAQYGLENLKPMPPVIYDSVETDGAVDLRLVADVTNTTVSEIVGLNPSLLRSTTPSDAPFDLHIPTGTKDVYLERIKEIPEEHRATWRFHVVRAGETLDGIALGMHAHVSDVADANDLKPTDAVEVGDELVVPVTPAASVASKRVQHYRVGRGDTLVTVADRFGVSVEELRQWNHLRSTAITPGRTLVVSAPLRFAPAVRGRVRAARAVRGGSRSRGTARRTTTTGHATSTGHTTTHAATATRATTSTHGKTKTKRH